MIVMKFDFDKIFSLSYMGKLCCLQNFMLLLWYRDTFIDSYCLLQIDYASFGLSLLWVDSVLYINCQYTWSVETLCNIHLDTNMDMDMECIISHMKTLCNIHMDTNMDMECIISHMETLHGVYICMECQSTWSVETLHTL